MYYDLFIFNNVEFCTDHMIELVDAACGSNVSLGSCRSGDSQFVHREQIAKQPCRDTY